MISRKRKRSCRSISPQTTTQRRSEIPSESWDSISQSAFSVESPSCSAQSSGSIFDIKGILAERKSEYLIDWADHPVTGELYEPDWVSGNFLIFSLQIKDKNLVVVE